MVTTDFRPVKQHISLKHRYGSTILVLVICSSVQTGGKSNVNEIGVYSFALKPEEHQPSGTCNFSRIDNAQLKGITSSDDIDVYAVNYNVSES